jgi:hypothetical protein
MTVDFLGCLKNVAYLLDQANKLQKNLRENGDPSMVLLLGV